jgi:broad specificity phosphatase PhoE
MMLILPKNKTPSPSPSNELAPIGTKLSGYSIQGPFHCEDCIHREGNNCIHPVVLADPEFENPIDLEHGCCTYVRPEGHEAVLFLLRHGETEANKGDKFRGMEDFSIDQSGQAMARAAGQWLKAHADIKILACSPLKRTKQTAGIVAQILGIKDVYIDKRLQPWNMGALAGKDKKENKDVVTYLVDHPAVKAPESPEYGGESLNKFRETFRPALQQYLGMAALDNQILLVAHGSEVIESEFYINQADKPGEGEIVGPGGILGIFERDGKYCAKPAFGKIKTGSFGS